jgi:TetR/AcrR family transcriptional regulator
VGAERVTEVDIDEPAPASAPAKRERSARNAAETKRRLLDAAEAEFAAKGFDGARLGNIAREAGVQQALIHHYFADKDGIYREVIARGLGAVAARGWNILERLAPVRSAASTSTSTSTRSKSAASASRKKQMTPVDVRALVEAFVEHLLDFYASHGTLLLILRHEAHDEQGPRASDVVAGTIRPQFDEICSRLEGMRQRGEIRADVDARHLCVSAVAMASFPFIEQRFLAQVWPIDPHDPVFLADRRREIVETLLARML